MSDAVIGAIGIVVAATIPSAFSWHNAREARKSAKRVEDAVATNGSKKTIGQLVEADHFILLDHVRNAELHDLTREEQHGE